MFLDNLSDLEMFFEYDTQVLDQIKTKPLLPCGRNIKLNNQNKMEYIRLMSIHKIYIDVKTQIDYFLKGFNQVIPLNYMKLLTIEEIQELISGKSIINIDELFDNMNFNGYTF